MSRNATRMESPVQTVRTFRRFKLLQRSGTISCCRLRRELSLFQVQHLLSACRRPRIVRHFQRGHVDDRLSHYNTTEGPYRLRLVGHR